MTINSKLGFGALALTLMSLGIAQQSAEPTQAIPPSSAVTVQDNLHSILSKNVSGELKNAPIAEIVSWLSGQGLSFVIKDGDVDGLLTMSIKDQPLDQAAEAIADALGGHWVRHGNVFTWHKGAESPGWATAPTIARGDHDLSIIMPKSFTWSGDAKDHDKLLKELKIFTDQSGKQLDLKQFEGMEIPMMELQTELGKELGTLNLKGLELKAMEPAMQESIAKALKEVHGFKLDAKQLKAMKAPMAELHAKLGKESKEVKVFEMTPEMKGSMNKAMKEMRVKIESGKGSIAPRAFTFNSEGQQLDTLMNSLTPAQLAKQRKQGFLRITDLSKLQQEWLGQVPEGNWNMNFSINGKSLNLKGR